MREEQCEKEQCVPRWALGSVREEQCENSGVREKQCEKEQWHPVHPLQCERRAV